MIQDSTPCRVFKISELTRFIASQLILQTSRKSAVDLACACQHLEEPVLSTLWETQSSVCTLLKVLPEETWDLDNPESGKSVVCGSDPPIGSNAKVRGDFSSGS